MFVIYKDLLMKKSVPINLYMKYFLSKMYVESCSNIDFYCWGLGWSNWFSRTFEDANYLESF